MNSIEASTPELTRKEVVLPISLTKENVIFIIGGKLGIEAIEDRILILLDKFKSGYECKDCNETGLYIGCECSREGHYGLKADGIKKCFNKEACDRQVVGEQCRTCKGTGITLALPENARAIPTSGIIVSCGPRVTKRRIGERVVFGAHTGYYIPFKGNAKIRAMREDEPLALIHAIDNTREIGEFMQIDEQLRD